MVNVDKLVQNYLYW